MNSNSDKVHQNSADSALSPVLPGAEDVATVAVCRQERNLRDAGDVTGTTAKGEMDHQGSGVRAAVLPDVALADLRKRAAAYLALADMAARGPFEVTCDHGFARAYISTQSGAYIDCGPMPGTARLFAASHDAAQLIRDFLNALPETSGAATALAPTSQIAPPAVSPAADLPELLP